MYKLLVLSALIAISSAKAGSIGISPILGKLVSEKTIESHGSTVVHSTAPLVHAEPVAAVPVATAALPLAAAAVPVAPVEALVKTQPISSSQAESQIAPKESNEGQSEPAQESSQASAKTAIQSNQAEIASIAGKAAESTIESHGHSVIHHAPAISYVAAAPIAPIVQPVAPIAITKTSLVQPLIQAPILKAAPLPYTLPIYYTYPSAPAALISEKTISSYGHSIVHHN